MVGKLQHRRLCWVAFFLGMAFTALGYRLVDLQVLRHEALLVEAQKNTRSAYTHEPRRGDIRDIRGNLLATSVVVKTVIADPSLVHDRQAEMARALAPLLEMSEADLGRRLQLKLRRDDRGRTLTNRYVVLKSKVPVESWQQIQARIAQLYSDPKGKRISKVESSVLADLRAAIMAAEGQQRIYPHHQLAAHVLGFVGNDEQGGNGQWIFSPGQEGLESKLDKVLSGARGWRVTEVDRRRREVVAFREQDVAARPGLDVVLTLDLRVQQIVEEELAEAMRRHTPISASAIVVRPRTGEILALANLPTFDPNNVTASTGDMRRNRVITDTAEPGSTFKIVVVSGALNERVVTLADTFDCENGKFFYAGRPLHDHAPYGVLTVERIITKSSNIGAAKIGIKLGEPRLYEYMRNFGFGTLTGIPLTAEVRGTVRPLTNWTKVSISHIPMGHEVAVTPLQMIMAMSAIASEGALMRPLLIDRLINEDGDVVFQSQPEKVRQVISPAAARQMVIALKTVVSDEGTAPKARLEHYTVAGKTGTAQKVIQGKYSNQNFFSSFLGFFPADAPEVCLSVVLDDPKNGYFGGQIAAPIFKAMAERIASYLNIRPDLQPEGDLESALASNAVVRAIAQRAP